MIVLTHHVRLVFIFTWKMDLCFYVIIQVSKFAFYNNGVPYTKVSLAGCCYWNIPKFFEVYYGRRATENKTHQVQEFSYLLTIQWDIYSPYHGICIFLSIVIFWRIIRSRLWLTYHEQQSRVVSKHFLYQKKLPFKKILSGLYLILASVLFSPRIL